MELSTVTWLSVSVIAPLDLSSLQCVCLCVCVGVTKTNSCAWFNPFTAPARKIFGQKCARIHDRKQYIWWTYFQYCAFWQKSCHILVCKWRKALMKQIWHFYDSFSEWRPGMLNSEKVNVTGKYISLHPCIIRCIMYFPKYMCHLSMAESNPLYEWANIAHVIVA